MGHAIHDGLLKARYLSMIRFGIMWENGCGAGIASADDLMHNLLPFWIDNYFSNPSYARINGKPVLYVWVPSNLRSQLGGSENVRKALDRMRAECIRRGVGGLYLVGCARHESASGPEGPGQRRLGRQFRLLQQLEDSRQRDPRGQRLWGSV